MRPHRWNPGFEEEASPRDLYWEQAVHAAPGLADWTAITDAALDNGCPVVAPGVHRHGTLAHTFIGPLGWQCFAGPPVAPIPAPVRAGGIVVIAT